MKRDSQKIISELITLRLDAEITDKERTDETVRLLTELQEAQRVELQRALETKPFVLACGDCDVDGPETYEKAVADGWTEIAPDEGTSWNFLGYCPDCAQTQVG